jgi:hypothetical protein
MWRRAPDRLSACVHEPAVWDGSRRFVGMTLGDTPPARDVPIGTRRGVPYGDMGCAHSGRPSPRAPRAARPAPERKAAPERHGGRDGQWCCGLRLVTCAGGVVAVARGDAVRCYVPAYMAATSAA